MRHASRISILSFNLFSDIFLYCINGKLDTYTEYGRSTLLGIELPVIFNPFGLCQLAKYKSFSESQGDQMFTMYFKGFPKGFSQRNFTHFLNRKSLGAHFGAFQNCDLTLHNFLLSFPCFSCVVFGEWNNAKYTVNIPKVMQFNVYWNWHSFPSIFIPQSCLSCF